MSKLALSALALTAAASTATALESYYLQVSTFALPKITKNLSATGGVKGACVATTTDASSIGGITKAYVGGKSAWLTVTATTVPTTSAEVVAAFKTKYPECARELGADAIYTVRHELPPAADNGTPKHPFNACINKTECGYAADCLCAAKEPCWTGGGDSACANDMKCPAMNPVSASVCVDPKPLIFSFPNVKLEEDLNDAALKVAVEEKLPKACVNNQYELVKKHGKFASIVRFAHHAGDKTPTVHPSCLATIEEVLKSDTAVESVRCADKCGYEECPCAPKEQCFFKGGLCGTGNGTICNSDGDWNGVCQDKKQFVKVTGLLKNWWMHEDAEREIKKSILWADCATDAGHVIRTGNVGQVGLVFAGTAVDKCHTDLLKDNKVIAHYFKEDTLEIAPVDFKLVESCVTDDKVKCVVDNPDCAPFLCAQDAKCGQDADCASGKCKKNVCKKNSSVALGYAVAAAALVAALIF